MSDLQELTNELMQDPEFAIWHLFWYVIGERNS